MTGPHRLEPPAALKVNPGRWAMICGLTARLLERPADANPHAAGTPARACWAFGHALSQRPRNVTRETRRAGRGRSALGRPRSEWSAAELALLRFCSGGDSPPSTAELAALLGRSRQAVRTQRSRVRRGRRS